MDEYTPYSSCILVLDETEIEQTPNSKANISPIRSLRCVTEGSDVISNPSITSHKPQSPECGIDGLAALA